MLAGKWITKWNGDTSNKNISMVIDGNGSIKYDHFDGEIIGTLKLNGTLFEGEWKQNNGTSGLCVFLASNEVSSNGETVFHGKWTYQDGNDVYDWNGYKVN